MFRCDPEPAQRLSTCSSAGLGASPAGAGCSLTCPATGAVASPPSPVPSRPAQPPASCAPSAPSPEVAAASDMSHSLAGLPLSAPAAWALQPSSACKDRKGPAPFHISSEARGGPSLPPPLPLLRRCHRIGTERPWWHVEGKDTVMLPATRDPGREPAPRGPFAPSPAGSGQGDPCIPAHPKSNLPGGRKHTKTSFLSPSPCLAALGNVGPGQPPFKPCLEQDQLAVGIWGAPRELSKPRVLRGLEEKPARGLGGSPPPALPGGQRAALSPACPPFAPRPRGRALAQPAWAGQGGRCHPSPGRPWGPSSVSQGHLLETALEIRHPPGPGRPRSQNWGSPRWPFHQGLPSPDPTAGSSTRPVPKTAPPPSRPRTPLPAGGTDPPTPPRAEQP